MGLPAAPSCPRKLTWILLFSSLSGHLLVHLPSQPSRELYTRPTLPPNGVLLGVLICLPVPGLVGMAGTEERRRLVNSPMKPWPFIGAFTLSCGWFELHIQTSTCTRCPSVEKKLPFAHCPLYARHFICIFLRNSHTNPGGAVTYVTSISQMRGKHKSREVI